MKEGPFREARSRSVGRGIPYTSWNPNDHYSVQKSAPLGSILSHLTPDHNLITSPLKFILILPCHLRLGLPSELFLFGSPIKILMQFSFTSACYMFRPCHSP